MTADGRPGSVEQRAAGFSCCSLPPAGPDTCPIGLSKAGFHENVGQFTHYSEPGLNVTNVQAVKSDIWSYEADSAP